MDETLTLQRVVALRAEGLRPKEIARALGIKPAQVAHLVRKLAEEQAAEAPEPALVGCWVSPLWNVGLSWTGHPEWREASESEDDGAVPRLVQVLVAREHRRDEVVVCGLLVDACCLGVKDALGPKRMSQRELAEFRPRYFRGAEGEPLQVGLELVQHLVLGAVDYARGLGLEPHPDFARCRAHLGEWEGPSAIRFGYRGKPLYVAGPRDDARKIMRTLQRTVGEGEFDYMGSL